MIENSSRLSGVPAIQHLKNRDGLPYPEFKKRLNIRLSEILLNIATAWAMLLAAIAVLSLVPPTTPWILLTPVFGLWLSFWLHSYTVHFHEAAHYNIHPDRKVNDLLSDFFLTPFVGMWVKQYRITHWKHHLHLGTRDDTEISYHSAIGLRQTIEALTGIYLLKAVARYFANFNKARPRSDDRSTTRKFALSLSIMLATQAAIIALLLLYVSFAAALSWALNIFIFFPFVANLRQTLEHRSFAAKRNIDYSKVDHGAVNRMFGTDFLSRNFGGAGFNRHLLHHFDPTVSYTAFDELEEFFMDTDIAPQIESSRTTYVKALGILLRQ